jgi:hypothetical protein
MGCSLTLPSVRGQPRGLCVPRHERYTEGCQARPLPFMIQLLLKPPEMLLLRAGQSSSDALRSTSTPPLQLTSSLGPSPVSRCSLHVLRDGLDYINYELAVGLERGAAFSIPSFNMLLYTPRLSPFFPFLFHLPFMSFLDTMRPQWESEKL